MLRNYFKTGWRNMMNNKFYSALTIIGLSIGLAVSGLIFLWVDDELNFDLFNHKASNIYRVNTALGTGLSKGVYSVTPGAVANYSLKEVPGVQGVVRWDNNNDYSIISYGDKLENPRILTPSRQSKVVPVGHFKLTPCGQRKMTPCKVR